MRPFLLALCAGTSLIGAAPGDIPQALTMDVGGLRSARGNLLVCLTSRPDHFPDCKGDPDGRHFVVPVTRDPVALGKLPPGEYAIAIVHDENSNNRLDTFAGIPREGIGFSRNPVLRFGAPSFRSAQFAMVGSPIQQTIRIKYFL